MKRLIESLDDPRQVIDPFIKEEVSIKAVFSKIVEAARDVKDKAQRETNELEVPERNISRGGQSFSESGRSAKAETDRVKSRTNESLPLKETLVTDNVLKMFVEGRSSHEDLQRRAIDPDINAPEPDFHKIIRGSETAGSQIERDARDHPRDGGK